MITLGLSDVEARLLHTMLIQYDELVQADDDHPVLERLFPDAYRDDPEASAEFSRYTRSGLIEHKTASSGAVAAALVGTDGTIMLADDEAERWLPVLTDLRLVLAQRIGIVSDDDEVPDDELGDVYDWLGQLQAELIDALESDAP